MKDKCDIVFEVLSDRTDGWRRAMLVAVVSTLEGTPPDGVVRGSARPACACLRMDLNAAQRKPMMAFVEADGVF
jgi:hypothetical protein